MEKTLLSDRIGIFQVQDYCQRLQHDEQLYEQLFQLLKHKDLRVASNSAWIFTHLKNKDILRLSPRFSILANMTMQTTDKTLQRLLLSIIYRLPFPDPPNIHLLNFCMKEMISEHQTYGIRSLCMKIAYKTSMSIPEIQDEIRAVLDIMEPELLPPSLRSTRKNILKSLLKKKKMRRKTIS